MKNINRRIFTGFIIIFIISTFLFIGTIILRHDQFGTLNLEHHNHLTGSTMLFATQWYYENPFALGFKMYYCGNSIETPTPETRHVYDTYLPGAIMPIYLLSIILHTPPNPTMIMTYNLFSHYLIAVLLSFSAFLILAKNRIKFIYAIISSCVVSTIILYMPENLYFLQNIFFADQAVLLPFAALIFTETIRDIFYLNSSKKRLDIIQKIILFLGIFTDWLFVFVTIVLFFKRLLNRQLGNNFKIIFHNTIKWAIPPLIAVSIYFIQVLTNNSTRFIDLFYMRTGLGTDKDGWIDWFDRLVWGSYLTAGFGPYAKILILTVIFTVSIIILYFIFDFFTKKYRSNKTENNIKSNLKIAVNILSLIIFPCIMQLYTFRNHSAIHDFSVLKLSFIIAMGFVLVPLLIYNFIRLFINFDKTNIYFSPIFTVLITFVCTWYLISYTPSYINFYPPKTPELETYGKFIKKNTDYYDIVFSPDYEIGILQHSKICWTLKTVRNMQSVKDIKSTMYSMPDEAVCTIFIGNIKNASSDLQMLLDASTLVDNNGTMYIYKITKIDLLSLTF